MNCLKLVLLTALIAAASALLGQKHSRIFSRRYGVGSHYGTPYLGGGGGYVGPINAVGYNTLGHGGYGAFGGGE